MAHSLPLAIQKNMYTFHRVLQPGSDRRRRDILRMVGLVIAEEKVITSGTYPGHVIDAQNNTIRASSASERSIRTGNWRGRALRAIHEDLVVVEQVYVSDLPSTEVARQQTYAAVELFYLRTFFNDALQLRLRGCGNSYVGSVLAQRKVIHLGVTHRALHVLLTDNV